MSRPGGYRYADMQCYMSIATQCTWAKIISEHANGSGHDP